TRNDVIIVASVSCIYGLGSPEEYREKYFEISVGAVITKRSMMERLVNMHHVRTNADLSPAQFRSIGNRIDVMPVSEKVVYAITLMGNSISMIQIIDPVSGTIIDQP